MIYFESFKGGIEDRILTGGYRIYRTVKRDGIIDRYIGDLAIKNSEIFREENTCNTNIYNNDCNGHYVVNWLSDKSDVFIKLMRSLA